MKPWKMMIILIIVAMAFIAIVMIIYTSIVRADEPLEFPVQEWIYLAVTSTKQGIPSFIAVMANHEWVMVENIVDLDLVTYEFDGTEVWREITDKDGNVKKVLDFLKTFFNISTIRPDQIEELFGSMAVVTWAYAWLVSGAKVHTVQDFLSAFSAGRIDQHSVTVRLVNG